MGRNIRTDTATNATTGIRTRLFRPNSVGLRIVGIPLLLLLFTSAASGRPLFTFESGIEGWRGTNGAEVTRAAGGAAGSNYSLSCRKSGSGFGCVSPSIDSNSFSGYDAILLHRKDGNGNVRDMIEIYVTDKSGHCYGARTKWAKTTWDVLYVTPRDLEYRAGGVGNPGAPTDLNRIDRIELYVLASVSNGTTDIRIDEVSIVTLSPADGGPFSPVISVDADSTIGTIDERIYGVGTQTWDEDLGIWGDGRYRRQIVASNAEYEAEMLDKQQFLYWPLCADLGIRVVRWPHGLHCNHYWWTDYIGSCDGTGPGTRKGSSPDNDLTLKFARDKFPYQCRWVYGPDEWMQFCEDIAAEPLVMINVNDNVRNSTSTPPENNVSNLADTDMTELANMAADLLEYLNADADGDAANPGGGTDWAEVRAANGHRAPYNVTMWEFGNELWTTADPAKYGDVTARCIDFMESRQAEIDAGIVGNATKAAARVKMYCLAVDNGGGGGHHYTDQTWYSTVRARSCGDVENSERIDAWSRHPYINIGESPCRAEDGKPSVSAVRMQRDDSSLQVDVEFPESGDYRFWIYVIGRSNTGGSAPELKVYIDSEQRGSFTDIPDMSASGRPDERPLLLSNITAGLHAVRFQTRGAHVSPFGGPGGSGSALLYLFPTVKAVHVESGNVVDIMLMADAEAAKMFQVAGWYNAENWNEPASELDGKPSAITEWSNHSNPHGNQVKFLAQDLDGSAVSRRGLPFRGDSMLIALGEVDHYFKFVEKHIPLATRHCLYSDENLLGMIEGVDMDSYVTDTMNRAEWETGRTNPIVRPTGWAFRLFSRNYRGTVVATTVSDSPVWETDWARGYNADNLVQARFGIASASCGSWECANNGTGYGFSGGQGFGVFFGTPGSGLQYKTIVAGAALLDNNHLNLLVVNHEANTRTVAINLSNFTPNPTTDAQILGIDTSGNMTNPQAGTDPEHGDTIIIRTNPPGYAITDASSSFSYTLAPRSIHTIKFTRAGADVTPPDPPPALIADGTLDNDTTMRLSWKPSRSRDVVGYDVYRARSRSGPFGHKVNTSLVNALTFDDPEVFASDLLHPGSVARARWNYAVTAVDADGNESGFSPIVQEAEFGSVLSAGKRRVPRSIHRQ